MKDFYIEGTDNSFEVSLQKGGNLSFSGVSTPEDVKAFMDPVLNWIIKLKENPPAKIIVDMRIDYVNTVSTRYMYEILQHVNECTAKGSVVVYNWHYEKGDDDLLELGEDFELSTDLKFNFMPYA